MNKYLCTYCDGTGFTEETSWGEVEKIITCSDCEGKGYCIRYACNFCNSDGKHLDEQDLPDGEDCEECSGNGYVYYETSQEWKRPVNVAILPQYWRDHGHALAKAHTIVNKLREINSLDQVNLSLDLNNKNQSILTFIPALTNIPREILQDKNLVIKTEEYQHHIYIKAQ